MRNKKGALSISRAFFIPSRLKQISLDNKVNYWYLGFYPSGVKPPRSTCKLTPIEEEVMDKDRRLQRN